jgi:cell division protein FtsI (penicillin-binding protein 3)
MKILIKNAAFIIASVLMIVSCSEWRKAGSTSTKESTIDSALQFTVDTILKNKMAEINATSGQAIVMEVATGEIKSMVGSGKSQKSRLVRAATLLAMLESGKVALSDTADANYGIYQMNDTVLKDHNWQRGGYGVLTVKQSLSHSSHIALYKNVRKSFDSVGAYLDALNSLGYGLPESMDGMDSLKAYRRYVSHASTWDDVAFFCTGDKQSISPIQVLTFINAIANDGQMVRPTLFKREPETIIPMIASKASIDSMQVALRYVITEGLGRHASSEHVEVAGVPGSATISGIHEQVEDAESTEYVVEFCGYFPADAPKYSIIVSMNKKGLPCSGGGMAGPVFRKIVDYMYQRY